MKVNSLTKKSALAAAIALVSAGAFAADLKVPTPSVFANEIFGTDSERTTLTLPQLEFIADSTVASTLVGKAAQVGDTIKLTLGQPVEFGVDQTDPAKWAQQGIVVTVGTIKLDETNAKVESGGTINDNQITIELIAAVAGNLDDVKIKGFKVRNLKSNLERKAGEPVRKSDVTVEVRSIDGQFENTPKTAAFYSINGVKVGSVPTTYAPAGGRSWLQAGDDYKTFTAPAGGDTEKNNLASRVTALDLGEFNFKRGDLVLNTVSYEAGKETGVKFDFTGADPITFKLTSTQPISSYANMFLTTATCATATPANTTSFPNTVVDTQADIQVTSHNYNLDAANTLRLCATAPVDGNGNGTGPVMPEATFELSASVSYYNSRYTTSEGTAPFGAVLRNVAGCQVSLFNLPNPGAQDKAFIRFTNTSSGGAGMTGPVYATVWAEDGTKLDSKVSVYDSLAPHATVVLHTDASNNGGVNLADKLPLFADSTGRSRIVLEGEFTNCEALGLMRSPSNILTNMTSTVYSGTSNNTSNTKN